MNTNDTNRRRPAPRPGKPAGQRPDRQSRRPAPGPKTARPAQSERPRKQNAEPEQPRKAPARKRRPNPAPAEIPEVSYSMPKPFSRSQFFLRLGSVLAVVLAIVACLSLFFRVKTIQVAGASRYSTESVQKASGINPGDPMLGISEPKAIGSIIRKLPFVKEGRIVRHLPGEVIIEIMEMDVTYAIEASDGSWWLIASDGRVLEAIDETAALGYTKLIGVLADAPVVGEQVRAADAAAADPESDAEEDSETAAPLSGDVTAADRLSTALEILQQLEYNEVIGQMTVIDVSDPENLCMEYGTRLHVLLGSGEDLGYKISYMTSAVSQLEEYEIGELDVSFRFDEKVYFNPAG